MWFNRLRRREFITLLGSAAAAWPLDVREQPVESASIGALLRAMRMPNPSGTELPRRLAKLGYVEDRTSIRFPIGERKHRSASQLAAELVALRVDVIVALLHALCAFGPTGDA